MRFMLSISLTALCCSYSCAEDVEVDKIKLNDGRVLIGNYDESAGTIELVNEKTGKPIASIPVKTEDVQEKATATISVVAAEPKAKYGLDGRWITNYQAALRLAKETNRPIMILFTGSDWCPSCIKLEKEILSTKDFKEWAKQHFVLLKMDFPNKGYGVRLKEANKVVADKFRVRSYPTILFVDANEKPNSWKWGYQEGGPENWIKVVTQRLKLTEQPKTEQPETEQPKTEQPKTEQPETEQPKTEQPKTEQPK